MRSIIVIILIATTTASCGKIKCRPENEPECQKHATYNPCGPKRFCFDTCGGPQGPPCMEGCNPGCFCDEGYILNMADKKCIKPENCNPNASDWIADY